MSTATIITDYSTFTGEDTDIFATCVYCDNDFEFCQCHTCPMCMEDEMDCKCDDEIYHLVGSARNDW